jgi:antitoxin Phd
MQKSKKEPMGEAPSPMDNPWESGERLVKLQESYSEAAFTRFLNEVWSREGGARSTAYLWMRRARELSAAVPNDLARKALVKVTSGRGLINSTEGKPELSARYAAGLRKFPIPPEGTSYEDCLDWAREVSAVAGHHASLKTAPESWQIQTAKARFSEVFRRARTEGPQRITRQGKEGVVIVAEEQYERLVGKSHQPKNLVEFFRQSPLVGVELDLDRDRDPGRDIEL